MPFWHLDATARAAWAAATTQQAQLEGLRDEWAGQMSVRYYSSADAHLATVTYDTPIVDTTTTPRSLKLGAWVAESHVQDGTAAYAILAVPAGADILRADVALADAISDPGGRVRMDIGTTLRIEATATLPAYPTPSWVPSTAWEWSSISGTTWTDYMVDNGSGIAPNVSTSAPAGDTTYTQNWQYSSPCYSQANHEMYLHGGGHVAGTHNTLTRWNLSLNSPTVTIADAMTANADRATRFAAFASTSDDGDRTYFADGKPYSTHSYQNCMYSDSRDEFFLFGFGFMASPGAGGAGDGDGWTSLDVAGWPRGGSWRADGYYANIPVAGQYSGPRFMSADGTTIYYWEAASGSNSTALRKFVLGTPGTYSTVGSSVIGWYSRQAEDGAGRALALGSESSGGAWLAKYITLSDGTTTDVTVSGDSLPTGRGIFGLVWCEAQGYWLAVFYNAAALYDGNITAGVISAVTVATITPTGASTATASVKTMTGTAPTVCGAYRGVYFDPTYECVLVVQGHSTPIKAFKVN